MNRFLAQLGIEVPNYPDYVAAGAALAILAGTWALGWFTGKQAGPRLSSLWAHAAGARPEGIAERMCALVRYLTAALLLWIAVKADTWPPLAALILGLGLAAATAMLVRGILRGLHMPRWAALLLASVSFVAVLAEALGGLEPVTNTLDQIGFTAGSRRFTLLALLQLLVGLLTLYAVVRLLMRVINHSILRVRGLDATQQLLAQKLAAIAILIAAFFIGIDLAGIDLTALAVFSGAFGLAVGFGLQKTFGNLIAGIILLMDRSIKPGDVIVVGGTSGHVTKIGVRAVSVITRDGKEHLIPNENLMTQEVENWSYSSRDVRVHIPVGVAYDCDLPLAQRLMIQAAEESNRALKVPKPNVWLRNFGPDSVEHDILVWIADPEAGIGNVQSEILNRLWVLFRENNISIPFPQRDIRVKEWPSMPSADAPRSGPPSG